MAYIEKKKKQLEQALLRWEEALDAEYSDLNRDATIQRFEFSFELLWKTIKIYLEDIEKINCYSPRSCFREIRNVLDLTEKEVELCLKMSDSRNLSAHTYSETTAKKLYDVLPEYHRLAKKIYLKIK